jgi:hypothetical protein
MNGRNYIAALLAAWLLLLGGVSALLLEARMPASRVKHPNQDNIVISEFRSQGPNAGHEVFDEFVEIFNPASATIDISGWYVRSIASTGTTIMLYQFPSGTYIQPGQHYLIGGTYYSGSTPVDGTFASGGIPDTGGVEILFSDGTQVDHAGMSPAAAEGTPLLPLSGNLDQSYERKPGGPLGSCYDSDDNAFDFGLISPGDPQNSTDAFVKTVCDPATPLPPPADTPIDTFTPLFTGTNTNTPTQTDTPNETYTDTSTLTKTITSTPSRTWTFTRTPSRTKTGSPTSTETLTATPSNTRTPSLTQTEKATYTPSETRTASLTRTIRSTNTPKDTRTPTFTRTASLTRTETWTRTPSVTGTHYTATPTRTRTSTRTPTRTSTAIPGFVIINEFLPHPGFDWNQDGKTDVQDEFIELINLSSGSVNISRWRLDTGAGTQSFELPSVTLLPRQIVVLFRYETSLQLPDGGGTVRLVKPDGRTADIFTYPPVTSLEVTWCRLASGTGFLGFDCAPTPGRPNVRISDRAAGGATLNERDDCGLSDLVPEPIRLAECHGAGANIWEEIPSVPICIGQFGKWLVYVE